MSDSENTSKACIFCKLANNEIPRATVYEDSKTIAIIPIGYVVKGHILVMPKKHFETVLNTDDEYLEACIRTIKKVSIALQKATSCDGINVNQNNFPVAGQRVPHLHFHLIPRFADDGLELWPLKDDYSDGEMQQIASSIKKAL